MEEIIIVKTPLPLLLILMLAANAGHAQCNPAFESSSNQSNAQFIALGTTPGLSHDWSFGDGYFDSGTAVSHAYAVPGVYTVKHYVTDSVNHCKDSALQSVTIQFDSSCAAIFNIHYDSLSRRYQFTSLSTAGGGYILSTTWSVDGKAVGFGSSNSFQLSPGPHTVCLDITTSTGCSSRQCRVLTGSSDSTCHFNASFNRTPIAASPHTIVFSATPASGSYLYTWNFGDGQLAKLPVVTHTYAAAGLYNVSLIVLDSINGCADTVWKYAYVAQTPEEACTASFTYSASNAIPALVHFVSTSATPDSAQRWTITNSNTGQQVVIQSTSPGHYSDDSINPTYLFPVSGVYYVCLTVFRQDSTCIGNYCDTLTIDAGRPAAQQRMIPSFPNPVTGSTVSVRISLDTEQRGQVSIYDLSGNMVYNGIRTGAPGGNTITIPVGSLRPGQYFMDIQFGTTKKRSIFRKL
jgi:PKD repeat protein